VIDNNDGDDGDDHAHSYRLDSFQNPTDHFVKLRKSSQDWRMQHMAGA
jgi:hypothetical protein